MVNSIKYIFFILLIVVVYGCSESKLKDKNNNQVEPPAKEQTQNNQNTKISKPPIAKDDTILLEQNKAILIDVLKNDINNTQEKLKIQSITNPKHGKAVIKDNKIEYIPNINYIGEDSFAYVVVDSNGLVSKAVVNIKIEPKPNNAPIAKDDTITLKENQTITIDVLANDSVQDSDALKIKSLTNPLYGKAKIENNKIVYIPNRDYIGEDSFEYVVVDSNGLVSKAVVNIKIEPKPNNQLSIKDDYITINEDTKTQIDVLANDGNKSLIIKAVTSAKYASVYIEDNKITYNPKQNYNGKDSFSYSVEDKQGNSASATVYITIKAINDAPVAVAKISPTTSIKGDEVTLDGSLSFDVDSDNLTYEWQDNGTFLSSSKVVKKSDFSVGEHTIKLIVSDGKLNSKVSAKIEVKENNTQPSRLKKSGQTVKYEDFDDGDYQAGVEFNYDRDNSKDIVIDYVTNLEWQDNKELKNIRKNWNDAKEYCDKLELGGFTDWRLPTREELYSIIDFSRVNSAYSAIFANSSSDYYWTSTTSLKDNAKAWVVYFYNGMLSLEDKDSAVNIRCVREHK